MLRWLIPWFLLLGSVAPVQGQVRRVVVLYDERWTLPGLAALDASLASTLNAGSAEPIEIYRESLDRSRFGSATHLRDFRDYLQAKYASKRIDVVVGVMAASLDFLLQNGASIFPGANIVFCGIDRPEPRGQALPPQVTGVWLRREFRPTLELALQLHPDTREVLVVSGTSEFDQRLAEKARRDLTGANPRVRITYISHLPMQALLHKLSTLPRQTVVLYATIFRDGAGQDFVPHEAATLVANASNAPVYAFVDQYIGRGVVGGHMYSVSAHGQAAAEFALRILRGAKPESMPAMELGTGTVILDWRQLRRWNVPGSRIPEGADVRYRPDSAWNQYRWHILGALAFVALQALVIGALIFERSRRRRHQARYALASAAGRVGVYDWNLETNELYIDPFVKASLGYKDHEIRNHYDDWQRLLHSDDAPMVAWHVKEMLENRSLAFEVEYRGLHRDGSCRWFLARGSAVRKSGRPIRVTGTATDITDRRQSEEALEATRAELSRVSRLAALGEFAASFAHEVRQPLTSITLNTQACLEWLNGVDSRRSEIRAALEDILVSSRHVNTLMQRNCGLFRLESLRKEPLDINAVVREALLLMRPRLERHRVSLVTSLAPDPIVVRADRVGLQQVLVNLIANSIDATLQIPASGRVEVATVISRGNVEVSVSDNGVGLGAVNLEQLFKLSYTTKPNGTGIGLSLSRSIVEAHAGRLTARQNPGPGATFTFTVPLDAVATMPFPSELEAPTSAPPQRSPPKPEFLTDLGAPVQAVQ